MNNKKTPIYVWFSVEKPSPALSHLMRRETPKCHPKKKEQEQCVRERKGHLSNVRDKKEAGSDRNAEGLCWHECRENEYMHFFSVMMTLP